MSTSNPTGVTESRLTELGITLPEAPPAVAAYVPWVRTGSLVVTSGQLPWVDGELSHTGRIGEELTDEDGYQAARNALSNALAQVKEAVGDLDRVVKIVRLEGNTHSAPGHRGQPQAVSYTPLRAHETPEHRGWRRGG